MDYCSTLSGLCIYRNGVHYQEHALQCIKWDVHTK